MTFVYDVLQQSDDLWRLFTLNDEYGLPHGNANRRGTGVAGSCADFLRPTVSQFLVAHGLQLEYRDHHKFAVCLTHDVDDIYPPLLHALAASACYLRRADFEGLQRYLLWKKKGKKFSPYRNFREIMRLEEEYGATSSFYFMASERDIRRFRYNVEDVESELGSIVDSGWEVGLHGGYYAFNNLDEMKREKRSLEKVLGKDVLGYRNHYLRFKIPDTWELLSQAGFKYDTTCGYNFCVGFRNGMCHPFYPFNVTTGRQVAIVEIPLIIMDGALFSSTKSSRDAYDTAKHLVDTVERFNGVLTVLWHNYAFSNPLRKNWVKLYAELLKYCYEKNAWLAGGEEISTWWRDHGY